MPALSTDEEEIVAGMGIRVTPEQLQQVSAQLNSGAASIDGVLRQLAGQVGPLGSDWAGVAQSRSFSCGASGSGARPACTTL
jgi:Proteins of 100 residues with WXG